MDNINLKPCPFCDAKTAIITNAHELEECSNFDYYNCPCNKFESNPCNYYTIVCNVNNGGCGASTGYFLTKQKAIKAWNRRTENA